MAHVHSNPIPGLCSAAMILAVLCAPPLWAGFETWTTNGPPGVAVYALTIDPANPSTVFVGDHGVWKTTDGGATWSRMANGLGSNDIRAVVINPDNPQVVFAGSYDAGLFRSVDGGATWTASSQGLPDPRVLSLAIDPSAPSTMYAGLRYTGAFKSTDGGLSWNPVNNGLGENTTVTALAIDRSSPQTIYAGTYDGAYKTINGGNGWTLMEGGLPTRGIASIAIDPTNPSTVYIGMEGRGVYKSTNGGLSWLESNTGLDHRTVEDLAIDPSTPTTIHLASDGGGMYKSLDGGATWTQTENGPRSVTIHEVEVVASSPRIVYAGTYAAGVYKSTDGGANWQAVNNGLNAATSRNILVDPEANGGLWAATYGGVWSSDDFSTSWQSRSSDLPLLNIRALARDAGDRDTIWLATWRGLFKTENNGESWTRGDPDVSASSHEAIATHPAIAGRVYAGNWSGLILSDDGGESWRQPETGPTEMRVVSFAFNPNNPATMYAGAWDGIFRSDDHGETWTSSLEEETIWSIAVDPDSTNTVYVCTYNGVFKSFDGGLTWTPASNGLTEDYCWALAVDPVNTSTIYQASGGGVFRTTNGGTTWSPFPGLEELSVYDLKFSLDGGTLYSATDGRGVGAYTFGEPECSLQCSTIVPETTFAGADTYFQASASAFGCDNPPTYEWDFGDGTETSNEQNTNHTYDTAETVTWTMTARADDVSCTSTGTLEVRENPAAWYVPGAAHTPGAGGTSWRTDLAAVNNGTVSLTFALTFIPYDGTPNVERTYTLAAGHAFEWADVLRTLFEFEEGASVKGTISITSSGPLHITARTYNQASTGTFGQYLPALPASGAPELQVVKDMAVVPPGRIGVIPQLKKTDDFRSNLGVQNLGTAPVLVEIELHNATGDQIGDTRAKTVEVGRYWQLNDVFEALDAGSPENAYATVEVLTPNGSAWFYGSVVDNNTGDPTTVPVLLPRPGGSEIAGVAHAPGTGNTTWRTDIAAVYLGANPVQLQPEFTAYNGGPTSSAPVTLAEGATTQWSDVLVSLFGRDPDSSVKGTVAFSSMSDLYVTARTYNQAEKGTFGQYLPAVTAAEGFGGNVTAVVPQLKKSEAFRSNLGVLNLSPFDIEAEISLYDQAGMQVGVTRDQMVRANEYFQIDDVFAALGAGEPKVAYATVRVVTPGGRIWAYGSVIDNTTGDPTTIPALVR